MKHPVFCSMVKQLHDEHAHLVDAFAALADCSSCSWAKARIRARASHGAKLLVAAAAVRAFSQHTFVMVYFGGCTMRSLQEALPSLLVCSPHHVLMPTIFRSAHLLSGHTCLPSILFSVHFSTIRACISIAKSAPVFSMRAWWERLAQFKNVCVVRVELCGLCSSARRGHLQEGISRVTMLYRWTT